MFFNLGTSYSKYIGFARDPGSGGGGPGGPGNTITGGGDAEASRRDGWGSQ